MKRVLFLLLFCLWAADAFTAAVDPPPAPSELNWTRRPVPFSHQTHLEGLRLNGNYQNACILCHHPVNGETPYLTCASPECHDELNPKDMSIRSYFQATHKRKKETFYSCVACHEEKAGSDPAEKKRLAGCKASVCHSS